jgi:hypothetical protein
MKNIYLRNKKGEWQFYKRVTSKMLASHNITIGDNTTFGSSVRIGDYVTIGDNAWICKNVAIDTYNYSCHFSNHYFDLMKKQWFIRMGCFNRTLTEWLGDFWNNTDVFPNDPNNKGSIERVYVFNMQLRIISVKDPKVKYTPIEFGG